MMTLHKRRPSTHRLPRKAASWACAASLAFAALSAWAQTGGTAGTPPAEPARASARPAPAPTSAATAASAPGREPVGAQLVDAIQSANGKTQRATLVTGSAEGPRIELPKPPARPVVRPAAGSGTAASRQGGQTGPTARESTTPTSASAGARGATAEGERQLAPSRTNPSRSEAPPVVRAPGAIPNPRDQGVARALNAARVGHDSEVHWGYSGPGGPANWGRLKPEFEQCATGRRQSPINIERSATLVGPAEPLGLAYSPSSGSVVNNGHTVQVDVAGDNTLTVRDTVYRLVQFHFHHPSEERIDQQGFAMVAHLVHRSDDGRLAVLAVPLDPGEANAQIERVWTHMPLDANDRVRLPPNSLKLDELLPKDLRYYQFIGSLTTPPCTEGVLWLVLRQAATLSREQLRLFAQLFPNNARPVQPLNGRPVREAR